jgi:sugar lactone lactonase YvrE
MSAPASAGLPLLSETFARIGRGLSRPECVLCNAAGEIIVSDWCGGVCVIGRDGRQRLVVPAAGSMLKPNGIALCQDGGLLLAHMGETEGGVWRIDPGGVLRPFVLEVEGQALEPTNYVYVDEAERVWITVSTRQVPRYGARRAGRPDGYIILSEARGTRIVADGLGFANEVRVSPDGRWLYAVETFSRRISRFRIGADGALSGREVFFEFENGSFPDGIAFDAEGGLWVACVFADRILRIDADRSAAVLFTGQSAAILKELDAAWAAGAWVSPGPIRVPPAPLGNCTSLAFGGQDLRTLYVGCLEADRISAFRTGVAGIALAHWHWRVSPTLLIRDAGAEASCDQGRRRA